MGQQGVRIVMQSPRPSDGFYCNVLLLANWSVCQKLIYVSLVQLCCFVCTITV